MIPTNFEEGLVNLYLTCERAARTFNACAERSRVPALRAAWRLRSQHCLQVAGGVRPWIAQAMARPALLPRRLASDVAPDWQSLPTAGDEPALLRTYEICEGYVLASYRDLIDQQMPAALSAPLLPQFEAALSQYVEIVSLHGRQRPLARGASNSIDEARPQVTRAKLVRNAAAVHAPANANSTTAAIGDPVAAVADA